MAFLRKNLSLSKAKPLCSLQIISNRYKLCLYEAYIVTNIENIAVFDDPEDVVELGYVSVPNCESWHIDVITSSQLQNRQQEQFGGNLSSPHFCGCSNAVNLWKCTAYMPCPMLEL